MSQTISNIDALFKESFLGYNPNWTVEQWAEYEISDEHANAYPNAAMARNIQNTPLFQALMENNNLKPIFNKMEHLIPSGVKLLKLGKFNDT